MIERPLDYRALVGAISIARDHCSGCGEYSEVYGRIFMSTEIPNWAFFCQRCEKAIKVVLPALYNQAHKTDLWCTFCGSGGHGSDHFDRHRPKQTATGIEAE